MVARKVLAVLCLWIGTVSIAVAQENGEDSTDSATREKLEGVQENLNVLNSDVAILKWVKVSGYVQARYESNDSSKNGLLDNDFSKNRNANNIYIRRGRAKFTFQPLPSSRYVFYIDASKQSISLKEAYADLIFRHRDHYVTLTAGQFNWPFGYEIEYSSSKRDFPERSLAENRLFKGERDRGINLTWQLPRYLQFNIGLFQGWGIEGTEGKAPTWYDPTKAKDVIARAKAKLGMVDFGLSGYWGNTYLPGTAAVAAKPGSTTWYDANGNNVIDPGETTTTAPVAAVAATPGIEKDKTRLGVDAQVYLDFLPIGGTAIRAELFIAQDYNKAAKDSLADEQGWYAWLSQSISTHFGAAMRYDYFDPNTDSKVQNDATGTLSLAMHYFHDSHVRVTAAYDIAHQLKDNSKFASVKNDVKDNRFTLQFQFAI